MTACAIEPRWTSFSKLLSSIDPITTMSAVSSCLSRLFFSELPGCWATWRAVQLRQGVYSVIRRGEGWKEVVSGGEWGVRGCKGARS